MALPSINLDAKEMQKAPSTRACEAAQLPASSAAPTGGTRCSRLSHGNGTEGIVIHRTTDPILPDPPPDKDAARANLLLYGRCRSPKAPPRPPTRPSPPRDTPHPRSHVAARLFLPRHCRAQRGRDPQRSHPPPQAGARPPPGSIQPNGAASPWRRQRRVPQPPAPLPPPRPRPSSAARSPSAPTRDPTAGVPRGEVTAGIGGRLDPRGTDKATPIPAERHDAAHSPSGPGPGTCRRCAERSPPGPCPQWAAAAPPRPAPPPRPSPRDDVTWPRPPGPAPPGVVVRGGGGGES